MPDKKLLTQCLNRMQSNQSYVIQRDGLMWNEDENMKRTSAKLNSKYDSRKRGII